MTSASTMAASATVGARLLDPLALDDAARDAVVDRWRALADHAALANPFHGPEMLLPALRHLAGDAGVRLLEAPGLVVPLAAGQRYRRLPARATTGWQHTHHFLGTPLVAPDLGADGWRSALDVVARSAADPWLVLPDVDAAVAADVEQAARRDGRAVRRLRTAARPVTVRRPTDDYLERRLSGSRRKELRRVRRRLGEALGGDLEVVDLAAGGTPGGSKDGSVDDGVEAFLRLEAAGWKGADGGAVAVRPDERAFFVEACRALADRGSLHLLALRGRDGDPAAMAVEVRSGSTLFTLKTAYDERHAALSPGLLLYMEQLHRFHASGARLLDTCAAPDHPMATRLHPDRRELVTLAVALRGRGTLATVSAPPLLRVADRARPLARRLVRRPHPTTSHRTTAPTRTTTDTTEEPR